MTTDTVIIMKNRDMKSEVNLSRYYIYRLLHHKEKNRSEKDKKEDHSCVEETNVKIHTETESCHKDERWVRKMIINMKIELIELWSLWRDVTHLERGRTTYFRQNFNDMSWNAHFVNFRTGEKIVNRKKSKSYHESSIRYGNVSHVVELTERTNILRIVRESILLQLSIWYMSDSDSHWKENEKIFILDDIYRNTKLSIHFLSWGRFIIVMIRITMSICHWSFSQHSSICSSNCFLTQ